MNTLYFGDNLEILRDKIPSNYVDLIYLDPPFKSGESYNIIFQPELNKIKGATAQIKTFGDTWQWGEEAEIEYQGLITGTITREKPNQKLIDLIKAMRSYLGECSLMAYLCMMAPRLLEMRGVMKDSGSIYLHCDPAASHYLKMLMDGVFGPLNFRNEIVWRRTATHGKSRRYGPVHDIIMFYTKSQDYRWNFPKKPYMRKHVEQYFIKDEKGWKTAYYGNVLTGSGLRTGESGKPWHGFDPSAKGRHWAIPGAIIEESGEDMSGLTQRQKLDRLLELGYITIVPGQAWPMYERRLKPEDGQNVTDIWAFQPYTGGTVFGTDKGIDEDVRWLSPQDQERLGYQTQKPEALLERIIKASSNKGDLVLDPFCGCGTMIAVAQSQGRKWIGIDITYLAIDVIKKRLEKNQIREGVDFEIDGEPTDVYSAEKLAEQDPFQFQLWCVSKLDATPSQTKTGDQGIDGIVNFIDLTKRDKAGKGVIQVKGTQSVNPSMVRDLKGTIKSQDADFGILITLKKATQGMITEAVKEGYAESTKKIPKIQLLTVEDLFKKPIPIILPGQVLPPYRKPEFKKEQGKLF